MAQEIINIASVDEINAEWTTPANIIGQYDVGEATIVQDASGDYSGDGLLENTAEIPTDINHFKLIYWNSGSATDDDVFSLQFYDLDSTSWIDFSSSPLGPGPDTEHVDGQNLTDILVKFDAAADKQDWLNAFAIRWDVQVVKGYDGIRVRTKGIELELEYTSPPVLDQAGFRICTAPGDNADPDDTVDHTWADANVDVTGIVKETQQIFIRFGVTATVNDSAWQPYTFFYNTVDNPNTATQITTTSDVVRIVDDPESAIANRTATLASLLGFEDFEEGEYIDASDSTEIRAITINHTLEIQVCVQFQSDAGDGTDHHFYAKRAGVVLDNYTEVPKVTTAPAEGGPRGPLGHPLQGLFRGPI